MQQQNGKTKLYLIILETPLKQDMQKVVNLFQDLFRAKSGQFSEIKALKTICEKRLLEMSSGAENNRIIPTIHKVHN